ncbi:MAG: hypothetical protein KBD15_02935 [Candidatus Magasanikbacteria bacterium]|nr:hypothetical protein [Candidatus Magasanikbacteria bacterium]
MGVVLGGMLSLLVWHTAVVAESITVQATVPALCGNGAVEGAEACDGNDLNGKTCGTQGFDGGSLSCSADCTFNTSQCEQGGAAAAPAGPPAQPAPPVIPPPVVDPPPEEEEDPPQVPPEEEAENPQDPEEQPGEEPGEENPGDNEENGDGEGENPGEGQENQPGGENNGDPVGQNGGDNQAGNNGGDAGDNAAGGDAGQGGGGGAGNNDAVGLDDVRFRVANNLPLPVQNGGVDVFPGAEVQVVIPANVLPFRPVDGIDVVVGGKVIPFIFHDVQKEFHVAFPVPQNGDAAARIVIRFADGFVDNVAFAVRIAQRGIVVSQENNAPLPNARVTLFDVRLGDVVWNAAAQGQVNPLVVGNDGMYGFTVPNGLYRLVAELDGYRTRETLSFVVNNGIVNQRLVLIKKAPSIEEALQVDLPVAQKAGLIATVVAQNIKEQTLAAGQRVVDAAKKVDEVSDNPEVEQVNEAIVAPATASIATVAIAPSLSSVAFPLLRYVFFQPFLLFGRRKRREWGTVYNGFTKLPIDLAVVRLIDATTKKVKQSRVTDLKGRYLFIVEPGEYLLEVNKPGLQFPSATLKGKKEDGAFLDVYHGQVIRVTDDHVSITPNIPLDPTGGEQRPKKILFTKRLRGVQHLVSLLGLVMTGVSLYISPTLFVAGLFIGHIVLYGIFTAFVKPKKPKGWGIVYEKQTRVPIANAVVRLFTKEYNKLVSTQITDSKGRFAFLVGPSTYYMTSEKMGYASNKTADIAVQGSSAEAEVLKEKVALEKIPDQK